MTHQNTQTIWNITKGHSPIVAAAIHDGHRVRKEVSEILALTDAERLREEDPFTALWTEVSETRIIGTHSRFEVDLNRPREKAVYIEPEDAWGLHVWKERPNTQLIDRSLAGYDAFYAEVHALLRDVEQQFGHFIVFDLHSYNHRRNGPSAPPADIAGNPEVNIGTGTGIDQKWIPLIHGFMENLRNFDFMGRHLDVRENIKFRGGQFSRWVHESFPNSGCSLAIEFKKFFMDEWTGEPDMEKTKTIQQALKSTLLGIRKELAKLSETDSA
ncbi:N-formylglutamate amidohydrolase [Candidatus Poribacteria bacterium]|nr:N-formylglutamate amidohydrolase [Candidatus Poribacteria bacterium]